MTPRREEVVIVGAGPCGLLTALLLARSGVRVIVLERKQGLLNHPRAMGISRRTAEILEQLGLRETLQQSDLPPPGYSLAIWATSLVGEEYGRVPLHAPEPDLAPFPAFHCPQTVTEQVLLDAVQREENATVLFGCDVESFEDSDTGVMVAGKTDSGPCAFECRYMVAADGAGSPIRHRLGIEGIGPGDLGHFINTFFRAPYGPYLKGRHAILHQILRRDFFEVIVSVNGDDLWLMHHFLQPDEKVSDYSPDRLAGVVREASGLPEVPVEVLGITDWVMSPKIATHFRKGRVFLVGDAAARLSPAAGLGMNTGLQSAHNLAWKLAAVLRGAPETLLDSYDRERRGHVMRTFEMSNDFGSEVWEILDAGFGGDFARVRDLVANSRRSGSALGIDLGWRYEGGAFVPELRSSAAEVEDVDLYAPSARPGCRAPHVWLERDGRRVSTIELFGRGFVLLVAGDASPWKVLPFEGKILGIGEAGDYRDPDGQFPAVHGVEDSGAVLVRPDGVVGWRSVKADPSALRPAMDLILAGG